jgi:hypothetical protein
MIQKHILNGLTLSLMLSMITTPTHAGLFSWMSDYFNKPTKNALIATTAFAGISIFAALVTTWNWWKASKAIATKESLLKTKDAEFSTKQDELLAANKQNTELKTQHDKIAEELAQGWSSVEMSNKKIKDELEAKDRNIAEQAALLSKAQAEIARLSKIHSSRKEEGQRIENALAVAQDLLRKTA